MTYLRKDIRGSWSAKDEIELAANRVLSISTTKVSSGAIVTRASVAVRDGAFLSHMMCRDFWKQLIVSQSRCTEKNVAAQHAEAMAQIDTVHSVVTAHYAKDLETV